MSGSIEICNLRNIQKLHFPIPDRGVWLLTAGNGAGKTSLLACLRRIGHPNAFPVHFPSSLKSDRLDNHSRGTVTYEVNGETVEYAYRGERWTPRPRSSSHLFKQFGYASVTYIDATAERIMPRPEDFDTRQVRAASSIIIDAANDIFETDKFSRLRTINLTRGVGNDAFVLAIDGTTPQTYHSEKHFGLGELCVLKLLRLLKDVSNNSMIIVDELEMAVHPRAQIRLLRYLEEQSSKKNLTVIFSNHSVTLLKSINKNRIIYLERDEVGETRVVVGCFPTYAIGNIASSEESLPDIAIYVEDLLARDLTNAFFEKFVNEKIPDPTRRPTAKVVPVGGFKEVVAFMERNQSVLPATVFQTAILDNDVVEETLKKWRQQEIHASQVAKFKKMERQINYLPFSPEMGLMEFLVANRQKVQNALRERFGDNHIDLANIVRGYDVSLTGPGQRTAAKQYMAEVLSYLGRRMQFSEDVIRERVCGVFANLSWKTHRPEFLALFGPMMNQPVS